MMLRPSPALFLLCLCCILMHSAALAAPSKPLSGQKIYAQQCARCHGKEGEGVSGKFDGPLHGNRTLEKLTGYIDRNMPDDDPGTCKGPDAAAVAKYIYDA